MHYLRVWRYGDASTVRRRQSPPGKQPEWFRARGYLVVHGRTGHIYQHRVVMEQHIGRPLRPEEVVHHRNRDKADNRIDNLALLPNAAAHRKLHQWEDALRACGHPGWRKCPYCKEYGDPSKMYYHKSSGTYQHKDCKAKYQRDFQRRFTNA